MLRASLQSSRSIGYSVKATTAGRRCNAIAAGTRVVSGARGYANGKPSISDSKPIVLPGSASPATNEPAPPGQVATTPSAKISIPSVARTLETEPQQIPLIPQTPSVVKTPIQSTPISWYPFYPKL